MHSYFLFVWLPMFGFCPSGGSQGKFTLVSGPIAWVEASVKQFGLRGSGFGLIIIFPSGPGRQAHQDALGAAAGLQAEEGPAVMDEVELHIAAAADLLPFDLPLAVGEMATPVRDREPGCEEIIAARALEVEQTPGLCLAGRSEVIIKDAADAAHF